MMKPYSAMNGTHVYTYRNLMNDPKAINSQEADSVKIERIMMKFKLGNKLSPEELRYLEKNSPDTYQKVLRILAQRKMLENQLKATNSKEEASYLMTMTLSYLSSAQSDELVYTATANHFNEAYKDYLKKYNHNSKRRSPIGLQYTYTAHDLHLISLSSLQQKLARIPLEYPAQQHRAGYSGDDRTKQTPGPHRNP